MGGTAQPAEVYRALADKIGVSGEERGRTVNIGGQAIRAWDRTVRWSRQKAAAYQWIDSSKFGRWTITQAGKSALRQIQPGAVITVFETANGVALWAEASAAALALDEGSCRLILTSPPYPLIKKKEYVNQYPEGEHVNWLFEQIRHWMRPLANDGSLMINLGDVFKPGQPAMSLYQERLLLRLCDELGLHLCERLYWHNPSKMPSPAEWVTVRRIRVTPAVENLYWLSKTANPYASNRNVLREYSASMRALLGRGGEKGAHRPSGYDLSDGAFASDNGGYIPHNLLTIPNTASNDQYARYVKDRGLPQHPARFPIGMADWLIRLLTEKGDLVWDPFSGSMTVAAAAEQNERRWLGNDKALEFILGGIGRFEEPQVSQLFDASKLTDKAFALV